MAARSDRSLRTATELLVGQARALVGPESGLDRRARARVVVLMDDVLASLESPTTGRPQDWNAVLQRRGQRHQELDELTLDLATSVRTATLVNIGSARVAAVASALLGDLPMGVRGRFGDVKTSDHLRATLLELVVLALGGAAGTAQAAAVRDCARSLAQALGARYPGQTIEVRVPPATAVQVGAFGQGPTHTRGTPPNVAETDEVTWVALATGLTSWSDARDRGLVTASGSHVDDVERMLPVIDLSRLA